MDDVATPPTPEGIPFLGNGLAFSRTPFDAMEEWAQMGDVVHLRFPGRSVYLVTGPALIEEVLVKRSDQFTIGREQRESFSGIEDEALTANTGERWKRLRGALQPAFTWDRIEAYGTRMAQRTAEHTDRWDDERVDLHREMRLLTVRILSDTLLGTDVTGDERVIMDAADALVNRADPRRFGQLLPDWLPTPTERRFERQVAALDDYVRRMLDRHSPGNADVCSVLLAAHDRGDLSMSEVQDNLVGLLLAGHDSSAVALTYAWYELSRHPDIKQSLLEEADRVASDGLPGTDDFESLERTRHVVTETLRLYPPTWSVTRQATEAVTLGGYEIPSGTQLMIPQWVLHRDERFWEDPETFEPSRWGREEHRPVYAYFPFSGGPRHCIGMRFARLELTMALATMATQVDLDVTASGPLAFKPSLSLRPTVDIEAIVMPR
jgi:cytochrome P450